MGSMADATRRMSIATEDTDAARTGAARRIGLTFNLADGEAVESHADQRHREIVYCGTKVSARVLSPTTVPHYIDTANGSHENDEHCVVVATTSSSTERTGP